MVQTLSTCRWTTTLAAVALILSANLHCAWEWQAALNYAPQAPIEHGCENESGCICRGALVAQPLDAAFLTSDSSWLLLELPPPILNGEIVAADSDFPIVHCLAPPVSGRQLRALYASLVI